MGRTDDQHTTGWFLPLRFATYVVLFFIVVVWTGYPSQLKLPFVLYSAATLTVALLFSLRRRMFLNTAVATAVAAQFILEVVVESVIIHGSGSRTSPDYALYLLTIVSAALAYRLAGTLIVASLVSLAYAFVAWLGLQGAGATADAAALRSLISPQDTLFYSVFLRVLIFYLVAFISGYLAERLRHSSRQLEDTSRALRRARLETDDILRHLNSGLLTIDPQGHIIFFNRAAERILGYREEEVRGMSCRDVFADRMPELAESLIDGTDRGVQHPRREIQIMAPNREPLPLGVSTSILTEEGGTLRGVIAIFSDLTDAKSLEAKVRAADRMAAVGELSASIAHEIRNPLAAISGSVEVLMRGLDVHDEDARLMELIIKESERLSKILSDFLDYARIDRRSYQKVELCHLVSETIQLLHHHPAMTPDTRLSFESDESIVYVDGEEGLLKQLLLNLSVNALEAFGKRGGELLFQLEVDAPEGTATLFVQDNGPGIPPQHLRRIFEPFYSSKKNGTGLGLAIVDRICSALKLSISVDSTPGQGTVFGVEMRLYGAARSAAAARSGVSAFAASSVD